MTLINVTFKHIEFSRVDKVKIYTKIKMLTDGDNLVELRSIYLTQYADIVIAGHRNSFHRSYKELFLLK